MRPTTPAGFDVRCRWNCSRISLAIMFIWIISSHTLPNINQHCKLHSDWYDCGNANYSTIIRLKLIYYSIEYTILWLQFINNILKNSSFFSLKERKFIFGWASHFPIILVISQSILILRHQTIILMNALRCSFGFNMLTCEISLRSTIIWPSSSSSCRSNVLFGWEILRTLKSCSHTTFWVVIPEDEVLKGCC